MAHRKCRCKRTSLPPFRSSGELRRPGQWQGFVNYNLPILAGIWGGGVMKRSVSTALLFFLFGASLAGAADLQGFYIGANGGTGFGTNEVSTNVAKPSRR